MILRKPYGFLIRHFRAIHLIILALISYLIYRTNKLESFFQDYIASGYTTKLTDFASQYFNSIVFFSFIILITILISILLLMKSKKKSIKYYLLTTIYYSFLMILFILSYNVLIELESTSLEASTIRVYRDIINLFTYPQYIFATYTLLRGVGFDIKSFNFNKDLEDLDLIEEDEEEIELKVNVEGYKVKRQTRRTLRELKYYILENKFVFTCLSAIAGIVIIVSLFLNFQVYNKRYKMNQNFALSSFSITYKESLLTDRDYQGNIIQEGKYYLATIVNITNNSSLPKTLDTMQFRLLIGNKVIYPTLDRSGKFVDIASPYYGDSIPSQKPQVYSLVYELTEDELKSSYTIKILDTVEYGEKEIIPKYKVIKLKPKIETSTTIENTIDLKEKLNLEATALGKTTYTINDYKISNKYEYSYEYCYNENCYPSKDLVIIDPQKYDNKTLLILEDELVFDDTTYYASDRSVNHDFYKDFFNIYYTIDGKNYLTKVTDITPQNLTDKTILMTTANIEKAEQMSVRVTVRNKTYIIDLKK